MTDWLLLLLTALATLACVYVPAMIALRALGAGRYAALGLAPPIGAAGAGVGAIAAHALGIRWSLLPFLAVMALLIVAAALLRRIGVRLPAADPVLPAVPEDASGAAHRAAGGRATLFGAVPWAPLWLALALVLALAPILAAFGQADGILERWDALYHLNALAWIRDGGDGSSLMLGTISSTTGRTATYPAAFHDLATLIPGIPIPILLNGATLALAVVPWVLGIAMLAAAIWPEHRWGPFAAAVVALIAPATPVDLWIHLSPIPNLVGMAMLPGVVTAGLLAWRRILAHLEAPGSGRRREILAALLALAVAGTGLALLHPNTAVTALLLLAVLTATTGLPRWRRTPWLAAVPVLLMVPVLFLTYSPLAASVTGFVGGWDVPWWRGLGEILLGLLTVWPMAVGVVIAAVWWPGLVVTWRSSARWVSVAWVVIAILYYDAATDSPLNLSVLYYRGQDRVAMPMMMLCCLLVVPGLAVWSRALGPEGPARRVSRPLVAGLVVLAIALGGISAHAKLEQARLNASISDTTRPRFLQEDELTAFARVSGQMDRSGQLLASPFSGAAHLYAMDGQNVRFKVAGMTLSTEDRAVINAVATAGTNTKSCRILKDAGIAYVYQEWNPYSTDPWYMRLNRSSEGLGTVLFTTDHSRLIAVDCNAG